MAWETPDRAERAFGLLDYFFHSAFNVLTKDMGDISVGVSKAVYSMIISR